MNITIFILNILVMVVYVMYCNIILHLKETGINILYKNITNKAGVAESKNNSSLLLLYVSRKS